MTLEEAKQLLRTNNIEFETLEFSKEVEYWRHRMLFPYTKNAKSCKVIAIIIKSNNEKGTDNCIGGTGAPHSDDGTRKFEKGL